MMVWLMVATRTNNKYKDNDQYGENDNYITAAADTKTMANMRK